MSKKQNKNNLLKRLLETLHYKYKLVIINESTFEEHLSFRMSRMNVLIAYVLLSLIAILFTLFIIYITPLKEYIPGYASVQNVEQIHENQYKVDSLETVLAQNKAYFENFKNVILLGKDSTIDSNVAKINTNKSKYSNIPYTKSKEDSALRTEWGSEDDYDLVYNSSNQNTKGVGSFIFFTPVHGKVINGFDNKKQHYGVDILCVKESPIKATLDGTVILSSWTFDSGYIIIIQHSDNLISIYKHNSTLLKSQGDIVKAGDPIAISGNSGEYTSGEHLHFELWYNNTPVNPTEFINFE